MYYPYLAQVFIIKIKKELRLASKYSNKYLKLNMFKKVFWGHKSNVANCQKTSARLGGWAICTLGF